MIELPVRLIMPLGYQVWAKAGPDDPSWAEYVVGVSSGDDRRDTAAKLPMKRSGDSAARSEAMRAYVAMAEVLSGPVPHVEQLCKVPSAISQGCLEGSSSTRFLQQCARTSSA
jgi:hypothetical protein